VNSSALEKRVLREARRHLSVVSLGDNETQSFGLHDFKRLRAFVVVAEELNFHRAAERLMMCQSPLSRMIISLEHDLGIKLFMRTRRFVHLTPAGNSLLADIREIVRLIDEAFAKARKCQ